MRLRKFLFLVATLGLTGTPAWADDGRQHVSGATPAAMPTDEERARQYFTDTVLLNQDGKQVRFYSDVLKDKVVLINFIYTNCKDTCPLMTQKMLQVKRSLGERFGHPVHFVSISVDAERDTPEMLRQFAEKQNARHPGWIYLTGNKASVDHIVRKLGQYNEEVRAHSTLMIAGNVKTRHWLKIVPMAPPAAIALKLEDLALEM
jgi:cytochrome oxidase Cu insertion factor (SCO1/SenC/PrrC family)